MGYLEGAKSTTLFIEAIVYACVAFVVAGKTTLGILVPGIVIFYGLNRFIRMAHRAGSRQTHLLKSLLAGLTDSFSPSNPSRQWRVKS